MSALEVLFRGASVAAMVVLFGTALFALYAPEPDARAAALRMQTVATVVALAAGVLWLILRASVISGEPVMRVLQGDTLLTVIADTTFGRAAAVRSVLLIVLWMLARSRAHRARAGLAAAAIASLAWSSHAVATPGFAHLLADVVHLLAAAAWIGGLIPLAWALRRMGNGDIVVLTRRFSAMGMACVAALLVTGLVNAFFLVGRLDALVTTSYGRLLCIKLGLFALMLALATANRFRFTPRLPDADAARQIARNSMVESAIGFVIVFVVAALGVMVPALHSAMDMH